MESRFTDGLILINTRSCTAQDVTDTINELKAAQIRFSMINSYYGRAPINYVGVDDAKLGEAAANYLASKGHRKIAFLSGSATLPAHLELTKGLQRGLSKHGLKLPPERVGCTQYERERAFTILDEWFDNKRDSHPQFSPLTNNCSCISMTILRLAGCLSLRMYPYWQEEMSG